MTVTIGWVRMHAQAFRHRHLCNSIAVKQKFQTKIQLIGHQSVATKKGTLIHSRKRKKSMKNVHFPRILSCILHIANGFMNGLKWCDVDDCNGVHVRTTQYIVVHASGNELHAYQYHRMITN